MSDAALLDEFIAFAAAPRGPVEGAFLVGQACARAMAEGGAIVNMSSVNGVMAIPSIASYNASKGGIDQLTRVMALALADHKIRVNGVAPGTIATELAAKAVLTSEEAKARIMSRTPMKRLGEPSEIADAVSAIRRVAFIGAASFDATSLQVLETRLLDGSAADRPKVYGVCGMAVGELIPTNPGPELVVTSLDGHVLIFGPDAQPGTGIDVSRRNLQAESEVRQRYAEFIAA